VGSHLPLGHSRAGQTRTLGEARRAAGIAEPAYLRAGDTVERIATIRCLVRWFQPPDYRREFIDGGCGLEWWPSSGMEYRRVVITATGAITS
jgi:hypothetical protein